MTSRAIALAFLAIATAGPASAWTFSEDADPMGRGAVRYAKTDSVDAFELGFPYAGRQHAHLALRQTGKRMEVLLIIEKGQLLCSSYSCSLTLRFDDGKPLAWSGSPPSDHSSNVIFLSNAAALVAGARKAKRLRIQANVYQNGSPVFEFDVSDLGPWPSAAAGKPER